MNKLYTKSSVLLVIVVIISFINNVNAQQTKKIEVIQSNTLEANDFLGADVQILRGNVLLKHDSSYMYCDSAYFNSKKNYFVAFNNIHIISPTKDMKDTVNLFGDSLSYYGAKKMAHVRNNVVLEKNSMILYTNNLDYDLDNDIGYYFEGGRTLNGKDTLISRLGYFYANDDELFFKDTVIVKNPKYTIYSDTLKHNTQSETSFFYGPTDIIATDSSNYIYSEHGWYNHKSDISEFDKNPFLVHGKQTIKGDKLFYDRNKKIGKVHDNVIITDTTENAILLGNYGEYYELSESSLLTDSAVFISIQKEDSLFLHADTLLSLKKTQITKTDTTEYKVIKAFFKAKLYKSDFQAKCDSLVYSFLDSIIEMHVEPILWSGENQLTSEFIKVLTENQEVSKIYMDRNALIVVQSDTLNFNQIKGKNMIGYVNNSELNKIDVMKDGACIYFVKEGEEEQKEKDKELIGVYKIDCVDMTIWLDSNEVEEISFYKNPKSTLYPPNQLSVEEKKFDNFQWHINYRPLNKNDIFIWKKEDENNTDINENNTDLNKEDKSTKQNNNEMKQP